MLWVWFYIISSFFRKLYIVKTVSIPRVYAPRKSYTMQAIIICRFIFLQWLIYSHLDAVLPIAIYNALDATNLFIYNTVFP